MNSYFLLFLTLKILFKATPLHNITVCEPGPAIDYKRDYKYYNDQRKLKALARKKQREISFDKFKSIKTLPDEETIHIPQLITYLRAQ